MKRKWIRTVLNIAVGTMAYFAIIFIARYPSLIAIPVFLYLTSLGGRVIISWIELASGRTITKEKE